MFLAGCWLLLQASWVLAQNCPVIDSIFPPSGTVEITYFVRGNNLDRLSVIEVDIGTTVTIQLTDTTHNSTHLQFVIVGTLLQEGLRQVTFTSQVPACSAQLEFLDLRQRKYTVSYKTYRVICIRVDIVMISPFSFDNASVLCVP